MMSFLQALAAVTAKQFSRVCAPGEWKVWRDDAGVVHVELKGSM